MGLLKHNDFKREVLTHLPTNTFCFCKWQVKMVKECPNIQPNLNHSNAQTPLVTLQTQEKQVKDL